MPFANLWIARTSGPTILNSSNSNERPWSLVAFALGNVLTFYFNQKQRYQTDPFWSNYFREMFKPRSVVHLLLIGFALIIQGIHGNPDPNPVPVPGPAPASDAKADPFLFPFLWFPTTTRNQCFKTFSCLNWSTKVHFFTVPRNFVPEIQHRNLAEILKSHLVAAPRDNRRPPTYSISTVTEKDSKSIPCKSWVAFQQLKLV